MVGVQGCTDSLQSWFTGTTLLWCPTHVCFVFLGFSPLASGRLKITETADNKSARHSGLWPPIRRQWDRVLYNCLNGESGKGVGEGHALLVLILRDNHSWLAIRPSFSFIWSQGYNVALFSVSKATVWPQSGPTRTPPGRVNTHPEVAGDDGEWSFIFLQEEMFFLQVSLGITDLKVLLSPLSGPQFPHLDHSSQLALHAQWSSESFLCCGSGMWKDPFHKTMFSKCVK